MDKGTIEIILSCIMAFVTTPIAFGFGYYSGFRKGENRVIEAMIENPKEFAEMLNRIDGSTQEKQEIPK
jgi:hypothetical protein